MTKDKFKEVCIGIQEKLVFLSYVPITTESWNSIKSNLNEVIKLGDEAVEIYEMENKNGR